MLKKITAAILTVCMAFSLLIVLPASAAANTTLDDKKFEVLQGLNIIPADAKTKGGINRGDFATWLAGFFTDDIASYPTSPEGFTDIGGKYEKPVTIIANHDLIDRTAEKYEPRSPLLLEHGAKIAVNALGYGFLAEEKGGYPTGYVTVANQLGLLKGVNCDMGKGMKVPDAVNLVYNCITTDYLKQTVFGDPNAYDSEKGITVLTFYRDIYAKTGVITENEFTSLTGASTLRENQIRLGSDVYEISSKKVADLIGREVEMFYKDNEFEQRVVCAVETDKNRTLYLDADSEPFANNDCNEITYLGEDGRDKTVNLDGGAVKVIYNGQAYGDYTAEDFAIKSGSLELISNDGNTVYDVAVITDYQTVAVGGISPNSYKITNKYTFDGALTSLVLDPSSSDDIVITKGEKNITFDDIRVGQVLSVAISKQTTDKLVRILVSEDVVNGKLEEIQEDTVIIDGAEYEFSDAYLKAAEAADPKATRPALGQSYNFLFDADGRIAYVERTGDSVMQYGYVKDVSMKTVFDSEVKLKIYTEDNEWVEAPVASKVLYNKGETRLTEKALYNTVLANLDESQRLIKFKRNADKEICEIETAVPRNSNDGGVFNVRGPFSAGYAFRSQSLGMSAFIKTNTKVFLVPGANPDDEEAYSVRSKDYIHEGPTYQKVYMYDFDDYDFADILVSYQTEEEMNSGADQSALFVVDDVITTVVDDEPQKVIRGSFGDFKLLTLPAQDPKVIENLKHGDIGQVALDTKGRIIKFRKLWGIEDGEVEARNPVPGQDQFMAKGHVIKADAGTYRAKISVGDGANVVLRMDANTPVTVLDFNREDGLIYGSSSDFEEGDYVFADVFGCKPQNVVIIRFKD